MDISSYETICKMKKYTTLFLIVFCLSGSFTVLGQMSKEEKQEAKEWKKKMKSLTPEQYKSLLDENKNLKSQMTALNAELSGIDQMIKEKDDQISQFEKQADALRNSIAAAGKASALASAKRPTEKGVVFKVKIGAFERKDLSKFLENSDSFFGEVGEDGLMRYTLGIFRDYPEADNFKKYMREMGVSDALIVSYNDGVRVPLKEVLDNVPKS